jgi:hypothetical protein
MVKLIACLRALAGAATAGFAGDGTGATADAGAAPCPFASGAPDMNSSILRVSTIGRFVIPICYYLDIILISL